jgi:hypothetical protein
MVAVDVGGDGGDVVVGGGGNGVGGAVVVHGGEERAITKAPCGVKGVGGWVGSGFRPLRKRLLTGGRFW